MTKEPNYLKRYKQLFAQYVDLDTGEVLHLAFRDEVITIRREEDVSARRILANSLILKYKFPYGMQSFIKNFILENNVDFSLIESNLFLVSPSGKGAASGMDESIEDGLSRYIVYSSRNSRIDMRALHPKVGTPKLHVSNELKLVIGKNASIEQIVDFIRANKDTIKQFQKELRFDGSTPDRIRPRKNLQRDMRIFELKEQGKKHREIADAVNVEFSEAQVAYGDIPTILRNIKKQYKKI